MKARHVLTILGLLVAVQAARADTSTYATQRRQVRCGIITSKAMEIVDNGGNNRGPENPDPYIFYVLDSRTDLKPLGLDFVNPLAPPVVTSDIYQRWLQRVRAGFTDPAFDPMRPESRIFRVGARTLKSMGCYWEVNVDALSAEDLKQYDLLYLSGHKQGTSFSAEVVAKLRRYVDGGGTLWLENCGRMTFGAPFIANVQFNSGNNGASQAIVATQNHPLLTYPFLITPPEVQAMGDKAIGDFFVYDAQNPGNQVPGHEYLAPIVWNSRGLAPISVVKPNPGWRALILAGQVGAGRYVVSCQDSGCTINDYVGGTNAGYGGNSAAVSGENFRNAKPVDMKFAYNLASWTSNNMTALNDVRRSGGTAERMGANLLEKWTPDNAQQVFPGSAKVGGAVQYKNLVYSVDGRLVLHCYDAKPEEDLDADGDPDDGIQDFIQGRGYDELWNIRLTQYATGNPTGCSAPLVVEFYDPEYINVHGQLTQSLANFNQRELVIVTLSDGTTVAFRAMPRVGTQPGLPMAKFTVLEWVVKGQNAGFTDYPLDNKPHDALEQQNGMPNTNMLKDVPIPTPAWSEGVIFVGVNVLDNASPAARVMAIDPRNGESSFHTTPTGYGGDAADMTLIPTVQGNTPVIGSPTVGSIRDNATGAYDKVVFLSQLTSSTGSTPGSVRAYWFGTTGEPLAKISAQYWKSRARTPWYLYNDAAHPKSQNPLLQQRVFHTFRDPSGAYQSVEFAYIQGGDAVNPGPGQFSAFFINNEMRVKLPPTVNTPSGQIPTDDGRNTFYADYTVDWGPEVAGSPPVIWRSNYFVPANPQANIAGQLSGPVALSQDDLAYYNVAMPNNNNNPGTGVLFAMNDQSAANVLKWTYAMHDGFTINVNGSSQVITPRLRQMDPNWLNDPGLSSLYGSYVTGVQLIGAPAYRNDVVYVTGRGYVGGAPVSVLAAFKANPEFVIRLNQRIDPGTPLSIRQLNPVTSPALKNAAGGGPIAENPAYVPLAPNQYTVNYESGLIRITSMAPASSQNALQFTSASCPFLVKIGNNGPDILVAGTKIDTLVNGARDVRLIGPEGVDNLIWYMVVPANGITGLPPMGWASTGPSVQGDVVWVGFQYGYIASFDADPSQNDPQFQSGGNQAPIFNYALGSSTLKGHLRAFRKVSDPHPDPNLGYSVLPAITCPPAGTQNLLLANTFAGVHGFEDSFTLVADNKRLVEVNGGGEMVWASDGTRTFGVAGGDLPIYTYDPATGDVIISNGLNATGVGVVHAVAFNRPTVARRTGTNEVLVVDTGNNRVVQIDRGGNVIWEVHRLFDDFKHLLRPGDPLNLNEPTDIKYWQEFNSALAISIPINGQNYTYNGPGYIIHYLISDTGNYRVIELVDVYDMNGNPVVPTYMNGMNTVPAPFAMLRQVNFVSSSFGLEGRRYRYRGVQRLSVENSVLPVAWQDPSFGKIRQLSLSMITNVRAIGSGQFGVNTTGELAESGGGSLVVLNERGELLSMVSNLRIPTNNVGGYRVQRIVNPTFFSMFTEQIGKNLNFHFLLSDENGVYQMTADPDPAFMDVEWMLSADDYYQMTGKKLRASSVRRLTPAAANGLHNMLIANRFTGEDNPSVFGINYNLGGNPLGGNILGSSAFHGEVFEINPSTFSWTVALHGYVPDYSAIGNFLVPNDGAVHPVPGFGSPQTPQASIVFRTPTESAPLPGNKPGLINRYVGDPTRATTSSLLEQPAFGDRPF